MIEKFSDKRDAASWELAALSSTKEMNIISEKLESAKDSVISQSSILKTDKKINIEQRNLEKEDKVQWSI